MFQLDGNALENVLNYRISYKANLRELTLIRPTNFCPRFFISFKPYLGWCPCTHFTRGSGLHHKP